MILNKKKLIINNCHKYILNIKNLIFCNLIIKSGKSKMIKKKIIYMYYHILKTDNIFRLSLNYALNLFFRNKKIVATILKTTKMTYVNHKKKFIQNLTFLIIKPYKRNIFFYKFLKFFIKKNKLFSSLKNIIQFNLFSNSVKSSIKKTYNRSHKIVLKSLTKSKY